MKKAFCAFIFLASCSSPQIKSTPDLTVEDLTIYKEVTQPNLEKEFSFTGEKKSSNEQQLFQRFAQDYKKRVCHQGQFCEFIPDPSGTNKFKGHLNWKDLSKYQELSISDNLRLLKKVKDPEVIQRVSNLSDKCPQNLMAAAAMKVEDTNFPKANEFAQRTLKCSPIADGENFYLRYALFNYRDQRNDLAKQFISEALKVPGADRSRTLYWAGVMLEQPQYQAELLEKLPYSLHAIIVGLNTGKEIFHNLKRNPQVVMHRPDTKLVKLIEKLLFYNQQETAYGVISYNLPKFSEDLGGLYYVMKLADRHLDSHYTTRLVAKVANVYPQQFNLQFLELAYKKDYYQLFQQYSPKTDPYLFLSLSKQESGFNPKARSKANARGLMQLLPSTARLISRSKAQDLYNVENNIYLGTNYFNSLYDQYKSVELALAAYNAGPLRVKQWQEQFKTTNMLLFMDLIPFSETRFYVSSIVRNNYFYVRIFEDSKEYASQGVIKSSVLNKDTVF